MNGASPTLTQHDGAVRSGIFGVSRQVVYPQVGEIQIQSIEVPEPGPGELILRVKRVGICATDLHLLEGHIGDPFPLVPGHEFVGEIAAVGLDQQRTHTFAVDDRVSVEMLVPCRSCARCREGRYNLCERDDPTSGSKRGQQYGINIPRTVAPGLWGGYADYLLVPSEAIVHRLPEGLPWDTAVLVEPLAVAFRTVRRGRVAPGDVVVVIGPGPVGLLAAAASSLAGASRVIVVGTRASRLAIAGRFGADEVINSVEVPDVKSEVERLVGRLPDVVIETAGSPQAQAQAVRLVRRGGRVVLTGACGANAAVTLYPDPDLLLREIDVLPSFLSAGGYEPAIAALAQGAFPFGDLVSHRFPMHEIEDAFEIIRGRKQDVMKAVLVP